MVGLSFFSIQILDVVHCVYFLLTDALSIAVVHNLLIDLINPSGAKQV